MKNKYISEYLIVATVLFIGGYAANCKYHKDYKEDKAIVCYESEKEETEEVSVIQEETEVVSSPYETEEEEELLNGYTSAKVNVRSNPSIESDIITVFDLNTQIEYCAYDNDWMKIKYDNQDAYIYSEYVSDVITEINYSSYSVPYTSGFKSYMSYRCITSTSSQQYKLQQVAYTGDYGIRMYDGRFCVAIGTYFNAPVWTYIDLVLENGTIIPCVVSDIKADRDTDANNIVTVCSGCVSEFIIDPSSLHNKAKQMGDISYCNENWNSRVVEIRIY